jgi:hypothetical protein
MQPSVCPGVERASSAYAPNLTNGTTRTAQANDEAGPLETQRGVTSQIFTMVLLLDRYGVASFF